MKKLLLVVLLSIILSGCTTTKYIEVPVDRIKVEYRDRMFVDTLYRNDSTIIREKGDTMFLEKYKYIYKVRELRDTINVIDTITVIKTIEVTKEINKLYNWQVCLIILGGVAVTLRGYKLIKNFKA